MRRQYFIRLCTLLLLFASCQSEVEELRVPEWSEDSLTFSTHIETKGEELSNSTLSSLGVFVYYTGTDNWQNVSSTITPNYLYNQRVSREYSGGQWSTWSYSPVMFWPKSGENISVFAYAPYANAQTNNISASSENQQGAPTIRYTLSTMISKHQDILYTTPLLDQQKPSGKNTAILLPFIHAMTKVLFQGQLINASALAAGEYIKIKKITLSSMQNAGTFVFKGNPPIGKWTLDDLRSNYELSVGGLTLKDTILTTNLKPLITDKGLQFHFPETFSIGRNKVIVEYGLFNAAGTEISSIKKEYDLSKIISKFTMGQGVVFNLYLGLDEPGTVLATSLPWEDVDVDGCFSATYLHVARTNIETKINTPITIHYDTDSTIPVFSECYDKPIGSTLGALHTDYNRVIIPGQSITGMYKIRITAGGLHRIIQLKINP